MIADIIVTGPIFDGISRENSPTMFAIKDGSICYVGSKQEVEDFCGKDTKRLEIKEGLIVPCFVDGHTHVSSSVDYFLGVNLYNLSAPEEYCERIQTYVKENPEMDPIMGRGYTNGNFGIQGPTAELLDTVTGNKKAILYSEDGHSAWVNTKVLELSNIKESTKEVANGVIARYENSCRPSGWLKEKAMELVKDQLRIYSVEDFKKGILLYQEKALSEGLWCAYEPMIHERKDYDSRIQAFQELEQENRLKMTFKAAYPVEPGEDWKALLQKTAKLRDKTKNHRFEVQGIKIFIDGVMEGHTAFLREPYADTPGDCCYNMWEQSVLNEILTEAVRLNLTIHIHTVGDGAIDSALEAFELAYQKNEVSNRRDCLTHLQVVGEDQYVRFQKLGLIAVVNPFWHFKDPEYFDAIEVPFLGEERAKKEYPIHSFLNNKIRITQASDWPVSVPGDTLSGLQIAVTRQGLAYPDIEPLNETELVNVEEMLHAITFNGAYQLFMEEKYGSIEVSKKANFVVLEKNLFTVPKSEIATCKVLANYMEGIEVYHA